MTIVPITTAEPACFGVVCTDHSRCTRYRASEGRPLVTIGTCQNEAGERPLFLPIESEEVTA